MACLRRDTYSVDALELKALSVPQSLLFLLGVEYDIMLCITRVGSKRKLTVQFPHLGPLSRKLLELCSTRMNLACVHTDKNSVVSGVGKVPVLRYVDFLPGQLHVDEILSSFGITKPKAQPSALPSNGSTPSDANSFIAAFIDYTPYETDDIFADMNNGVGYYLTSEHGLTLATHSHLVAVTFKQGKKPADAVASFQRFCGWNTFDLRFDDETTKRSGVVVMPTAQDAMDLFEKYEDEDSDDDDDYDDNLLFSLRPVASLVPVPYVEDAQLRKLRTQHWPSVLQFWEAFPKTRYCVVVSNLFDKATLADVLRLFDGLSIVDSSMVEDQGPYRRRKAFITFVDGNTTKEALGLDGKNTHGKALRIQVSPPYVDHNRRGTLVKSRSASPSPQATPSATTPQQRQPSPLPEMTLPEAASPAPAPSTTALHGVADSPQVTSNLKPSADPFVSPKVEASPPVGAEPKKGGMNAAAKEFVPKFAISPPMGSLPPPYGGAPPPPYCGGNPVSPQLPPPPYGSPPPPPYTGTPSSAKGTSPAGVPPTYSLPPPYAKSPVLPPPTRPPPPPSYPPPS